MGATEVTMDVEKAATARGVFRSWSKIGKALLVLQSNNGGQLHEALVTTTNSMG